MEATKASLMRAVRARRAALTLGLTGFLTALPALLVGFADCFDVELLGLAGTGFLAVGDGFWAAFWTGFFAVCAGFFVGVDAEPAGAVAEPLEDCPANGNTISSVESRTTRRRVVRRGT